MERISGTPPVWDPVSWWVSLSYLAVKVLTGSRCEDSGFLVVVHHLSGNVMGLIKYLLLPLSIFFFLVRFLAELNALNFACKQFVSYPHIT